jgi:hypothetical protein
MKPASSRVALAAALLACAFAGTAQAQVPLVVATPTSFNFGTTITGAVVTLNGTLKGTADTIRVDAVVRCDGTSTEFALPNGISPGVTLQTNQTRPFSLSYRPVDATADAGCFLIQLSNRYATPPTYDVLQLDVSGAAVGDPVPRLVAANGFSFGRVQLGTTASQTVQLENQGAADLVIDVVTLGTTATTEFTLVSPALPAIIPPGASLPVTVTYAPAGLGPDSASVQVGSNDPLARIRQLAVSGEGFDPSATLDVDITGVVVPATAKAHKPVSLSVRTANVGALSGTIAIEAVAAQNGVEVYRSSLAPFSAAGEVVEYAGFGFTPRSRGTVTWTITLTDGNDDVDVATADTVVR